MNMYKKNKNKNKLITCLYNRQTNIDSTFVFEYFN